MKRLHTVRVWLEVHILAECPEEAERTATALVLESIAVPTELGPLRAATFGIGERPTERNPIVGE